MYINEWNIAEADARQFNVTNGNQAFSSASEWIKGGLVPALMDNKAGFKNLSVTLLVYGNSRAEARLHISEILSHLLEPADIHLEGFDTTFRGTLTGHTVTEHKRIAGWSGWRRFLQLVLTFQGFECGEEIKNQITTGDEEDAEMVIVNPGTADTPLYLVIECQNLAAEAESIRVSGLPSSDIVLPHESATDTFILDGTTGLLRYKTATTDEEPLPEGAEVWALPYVSKGNTTLTIEGAGANTIITAIYAPRYL